MPTSKERAREYSSTGIKLQDCVITVKGSSPLICNKWSEKAKQEIRDKQMKIAKAPGRKRRILKSVLMILCIRCLMVRVMVFLQLHFVC